ncbi:MAG: site-2 protease family protein, partial [Catalinimonas sp.]
CLNCCVMPDRLRRYGLHLLLFGLTLVTTTLAGTEWTSGVSLLAGDKLAWVDLRSGLHYSLPFLLILTCHEFGHYFTARFYRIAVTLPYYIPFLPTMIGTMGAFIRIKQMIPTRQQYFDVGVAGPLAGFVVALGVIWWGFAHLPPPEHIYTIHPEYEQYGPDYAQRAYSYESMRARDSLAVLDFHAEQRARGEEITPITLPSEYTNLALGNNLIFAFFKRYVADPERLPNPYEMYHYPFLMAGYLALLFTALNLIPIGQLDGGHVLYGMIGHRRHSLISPVLFGLFVFYAGLGAVWTMRVETDPNYFWLYHGLYLGYLYLIFSGIRLGAQRTLLLALTVFVVQYLIVLFLPVRGNTFWLLFIFLIGRVLGVFHPPAVQEAPISTGRRVLGWLSLAVFVGSFTPMPLVIETVTRFEGPALIELPAANVQEASMSLGAEASAERSYSASGVAAFVGDSSVTNVP